MMLTDLADVLRAAGQQVMELPGWQQRGESDGRFEPLGILLHHDAMGLGFNSNPDDDLNVPKYMSQNGVDGAQLWVSRTGLWVVMAAGRKWHAGIGQGWGAVPANSGNTYLLGVETDHTDGNPWTPEQARAINDGCRALVRHYGWKPSNCCGHKEYAPGRKHDPSDWDLDAWRRYLATTPSATTPAAPTTNPTPPEEDDMPLTDADAQKVADKLLATKLRVVDAARKPDTYEASVGEILQRLVRLEGLDWARAVPSPAAIAAAVKKAIPTTSDASAQEIAQAVVTEIGKELSA